MALNISSFESHVSQEYTREGNNPLKPIKTLSLLNELPSNK